MKVLVGCGAIDRLGELCRELCNGTVLVVTDPGIEQAGIVDRALRSLQRNSVPNTVFTGVEENPTTAHVSDGVASARQHGDDIRLIVGLGGGSAMDCAKGVNFLLSNGGRMEDFWGDGKAQGPMLPSVGIPTTAGTGSEAQRYALIAQEETRRKMACGDEKARFTAAILDPELIGSAPRSVAAAAGIDAISHAVESYVATTATPSSRLLARQALQLLAGHIEEYLDDPQKSSRVRHRMLLGAHWAGASIERSMLGAAHACANPLTARYGIKHGVAVGLMLPHVVEFNSEAVNGEYGTLGVVVGGGGCEFLVERILELNRTAGVPERLRELDVEKMDFSDMALEAAGQKTARYNPRPVAAGDLQSLYEAAY